MSLGDRRAELHGEHVVEQVDRGDVGEVGLGGEVRGVSQAALRIREAEQMGFTRIVLPASNIDSSMLAAPFAAMEASEEMGKAELVGVRSVGEALDMLLS